MFRLGSLKIPWVGVYAIFYVAFLYAPVLVLPVFSFNQGHLMAFPLKGFTFEWYAAMAADESLMRALGNSLKIGVAVAFVSTVFGTMGAKAVTRYRMPGKSAVVSFIMSPLVLPGIIMAVALLVIFREILGLTPSLFTVSIGHVLICLPFSMAIMMSRLEGFDRALEEASQDLGESPWTTFWRVTFPIAFPGIVASFLLAFITSFDEFVMAFFLSGNETTLPVFIFSQMRFPLRLPIVLALGTVVLALSMVVVLLSLWLSRRGAVAKKPIGGGA